MRLFQVFASKMDFTGVDLFVITLLCLGSLSSAQFTVRPRNFIAIRDTEIQFTCESEVTSNQLNVIWERSDGVDNFVRIAFDETVETGLNKYSVDFEGRTPTQTSKSVLTLTGVLPEDAGTFHCRLVTGSAYAQLVVFDSDPQVETNTTMDEVIEGEFIGLSCFVGYRSAISWAPTITWRERTIGGLSVIDQSSPNEARSVYASVTERDHTGRLFECGAEFGTIPEENIPTVIRDDHDMDPPVYTFSSGSLGLTVVYPVENLQLTDPKEVYNPEERLTIVANGRPGPSFSWQNLIDNSTVDGTILTITSEMEGVQNWTYMAYNTIRGERFEIIRSHNFLVQIPTTTTTTTTPSTTTSSTTTGDAVTDPNNGGGSGLSGGAIAGIVIGCSVGLALIILLIFCCISRNKAPKTTKEKTSKANHVDAIRNQPQMVLPPGDMAYIDKEKGPPPYNPYAPPSVKTEEGMVYADLAFEDKPRSRKPIQVYENTEYGDIL